MDRMNNKLMPDSIFLLRRFLRMPQQIRDSDLVRIDASVKPTEEDRILWLRFARYVTVGLFNAAVFYVAFSVAKDHVGLSRGVAVTLAYAISLILGYSAHATVTFERTLWNFGQVWRFVITVSLGYLISQLVMFVGYELRLPEIISVGFLAISIALVNWIVFKAWVFGG